MAPMVERWVSACFPEGSESSVRELEEVINEASDAARDDHDEASANKWAEGYEFPQRYIDSDVACLRAAGLDFAKMVKRRLALISAKRLSRERVERTLREDNPERDLMLDLAIGMKVHKPAGFVPNGCQPRSPLRAVYCSVASAVNNMLGAVVEQRLAFLLPLQLAQEHVPNLHLCKAHWTTKKGKASGRPLGDLSNVDGTPINTDETAEAATAYYGQIQHPTIDGIAAMIQEFWTKAKTADPSRQWSDLRLWKMDLKGAFTLLSFRPNDVGLFGMLLTNELVYLQLAGIFGWAGTPAAFQVVTRAILWETQHRLQSRTVMYVDDIVGVGFVDQVESDMAVTRRICTDLLGPDAVADDKSESASRLDVIGYTIDLTKERVLIARKNFLTALHGFMSTDVTRRINLRQAQRLASWGTRYGKICRVMCPFCSALNRVTWGRTDPHALFFLSFEAVIAIQCWRAMLCLVRYRETEFTRTIESFAPTTPVIVAEFDASLKGAGLIWFARGGGTEVALGVCAVDLSFLEFGDDSSYQNLAEFIGAIIAVAGQILLGFSGRSLALRGDSVTANTWAFTERPRGSIVTNASMVWTLLCLAADINVTEVTHIAGVDNKNCDFLSRKGTHPTTSIAEDVQRMGLGNVAVLDLCGADSAIDIVRLCDPRVKLDSEEDFVRFWVQAKTAIDMFLTSTQQGHQSGRPGEH